MSRVVVRPDSKGSQLVDRHEELRAHVAAYNRDFDAFVNNELEAWWAVAGGLVTAAFASADRSAFYDAHVAEFDAIEQQHGVRFAYLTDWLRECCRLAYFSHIPRKVDGAWINMENCGLYDCFAGKGYVCRWTMSGVARRI